MSDPPPAKGKAGALYELTKPGIAGYVMMTAGVSYYVGAAGAVDFFPIIHTLVGVALGTAGALALNQYVERDVDAIMTRTQKRPLPSGRLQPREALAFGWALLVAGLIYLGVLVGWLPSVLTAASAAAYILAYTPLKTRSYLATLVGAVPGAFPALIGWSAATGTVEFGAVVLFCIAFLWQLPHVLALAWILREDYARVGFFLSPPTDPQGVRIGRHMVYHSLSLLNHLPHGCARAGGGHARFFRIRGYRDATEQGSTRVLVVSGLPAGPVGATPDRYRARLNVSGLV